MNLQPHYKEPSGAPGDGRRTPNIRKPGSVIIRTYGACRKYGSYPLRGQYAHHGRHAQMNTPLKSRTPPPLGSAPTAGRPEEVFGARAFVARTLSAADKTPALDSDAATLLTSELVTNAIQHTASGAPGGTVTIVVVNVPDGVLVEVIDDGSADTP